MYSKGDDGSGMGESREIDVIQTTDHVAAESFLRYEPSESMGFGAVSKTLCSREQLLQHWSKRGFQNQNYCSSV